MELDVGVGAQEALDRFLLKKKKKNGNNMNLSVGGLSGDHLAQELYKLGTWSGGWLSRPGLRRWPCSRPHRGKECRGEKYSNP